MYTDWKTRREHQLKSPDDAVKLISSGNRVYIPGNCGAPKEFINAIIHRAPHLEKVEIVQGLSLINGFENPNLKGHIRMNTPFIGPAVRSAINNDGADFTPCLLSEMPFLFKNGSTMSIDVAVVHTSPPDNYGFCKLGANAGLDITAARKAKIRIAEVNEQMPRLLGDCCQMHASFFDCIIPVSYMPVEFLSDKSDETSSRIAQFVADMINDGSTIQIGIGPIPNAVLKFLESKHDLGIHSELIPDGMVDLIKSGAITGAKKSTHQGKVVAGFILGSRKLFEFVNGNSIFDFHPTEYINDPFEIAKNENVVAVNAAIEVDLTGQVCADSIGSSFYSGIGGQFDFIYGAARSKNGKPIIALPSTAKNNAISRIVPQLKPGAGVTVSRYHVHYIVTEYGIASLYGRTLKNRVKSLINIAHPNFREDLAKKAFELWRINV